MTRYPLLIVEDDPDGQELVARLLKQVNREADIAANAEDAWAMLRSGGYVGAIIDLALPGQDGFQLLNAIRNDPELANLHCIAMSAYHTPRLKVDALDSGFNAFFSKPLNRTLFLGAVEDIFWQ
ncbi:MAG: response regulator [Anaerolineae bacterium]|nr:response regulator [Anaerolineae bacterium]